MPGWIKSIWRKSIAGKALWASRMRGYRGWCSNALPGKDQGCSNSLARLPRIARCCATRKRISRNAYLKRLAMRVLVNPSWAAGRLRLYFWICPLHCCRQCRRRRTTPLSLPPPPRFTPRFLCMMPSPSVISPSDEKRCIRTPGVSPYRGFPHQPLAWSTWMPCPRIG